MTIGADIFRYYFEIQYGWVTLSLIHIYYLSSRQVEQIIEDTNAKVCSRCYQREICWGEHSQDLVKGVEALVRSMAVSYTHLDVYKRQVQATSRCMPFEQEHLSDVCVCCGKPAKKMVYWGRAY